MAVMLWHDVTFYLLRALASTADQFSLGAFVHACFERRAELAPSETR